MADGMLLECTGLSLGYRAVPVVSGLDLSWSAGEGPLGITGPNGSGKSTFLKACLGLLRPLGGELKVLGSRPGTKIFRRNLRRIAWIPQQKDPGALRITVRELVGLGRGASVPPFGRFSAADRKAIDEAMGLCRIGDLGSLAVQEISGGQYQRASIARALATDAELLFLDEPTTFLDHDSRLGVRKVIEDILKEGKVALALVSHDAALFDLCSRLWYFFDGTVQATSPEAER